MNMMHIRSLALLMFIAVFDWNLIRQCGTLDILGKRFSDIDPERKCHDTEMHEDTMELKHYLCILRRVISRYMKSNINLELAGSLEHSDMLDSNTVMSSIPTQQKKHENGTRSDDLWARHKVLQNSNDSDAEERRSNVKVMRDATQVNSSGLGIDLEIDSKIISALRNATEIINTIQYSKKNFRNPESKLKDVKFTDGIIPIHVGPHATTTETETDTTFLTTSSHVTEEATLAYPPSREQMVQANPFVTEKSQTNAGILTSSAPVPSTPEDTTAEISSPNTGLTAKTAYISTSSANSSTNVPQQYSQETTHPADKATNTLSFASLSSIVQISSGTTHIISTLASSTEQALQGTDNAETSVNGTAGVDKTSSPGAGIISLATPGPEESPEVSTQLVSERTAVGTTVADTTTDGTTSRHTDLATNTPYFTSTDKLSTNDFQDITRATPDAIEKTTLNTTPGFISTRNATRSTYAKTPSEETTFGHVSSIESVTSTTTSTMNTGSTEHRLQETATIELTVENNTVVSELSPDAGIINLATPASEDSTKASTQFVPNITQDGPTYFASTSKFFTHGFDDFTQGTTETVEKTTIDSTLGTIPTTGSQAGNTEHGFQEITTVEGYVKRTTDDTDISSIDVEILGLVTPGADESPEVSTQLVTEMTAAETTLADTTTDGTTSGHNDLTTNTPYFTSTDKLSTDGFQDISRYKTDGVDTFNINAGFTNRWNQSRSTFEAIAEDTTSTMTTTENTTDHDHQEETTSNEPTEHESQVIIDTASSTTRIFLRVTQTPSEQDLAIAEIFSPHTELAMKKISVSATTVILSTNATEESTLETSNAVVGTTTRPTNDYINNNTSTRPASMEESTREATPAFLSSGDAPTSISTSTTIISRPTDSQGFKHTTTFELFIQGTTVLPRTSFTNTASTSSVVESIQPSTLSLPEHTMAGALSRHNELIRERTPVFSSTAKLSTNVIQESTQTSIDAVSGTTIQPSHDISTNLNVNRSGSFVTSTQENMFFSALPRKSPSATPIMNTRASDIEEDFQASTSFIADIHASPVVTRTPSSDVETLPLANSTQGKSTQPPEPPAAEGTAGKSSHFSDLTINVTPVSETKITTNVIHEPTKDAAGRTTIHPSSIVISKNSSRSTSFETPFVGLSSMDSTLSNNSGIEAGSQDMTLFEPQSSVTTTIASSVDTGFLATLAAPGPGESTEPPRSDVSAITTDGQPSHLSYVITDAPRVSTSAISSTQETHVSTSTDSTTVDGCNIECTNGVILREPACRCNCTEGYRGSSCSDPPCRTACAYGWLDPETCLCHCHPEWYGPNCDCDLKCRHGMFDPYACTCTCTDGYLGLQCGKPPCTTTCVHGLVNEITCLCECDDGWSGHECDCSLRCENGGLLDPSSCRCRCVGGYRGANCSVTPCQDVRCDHGLISQHDCRCQCFLGWSGDACGCGQLCNNNGTLDVETCQCTCAGHFSGGSCSEYMHRRSGVALLDPDCSSPRNCEWVAARCSVTCNNGQLLSPATCTCEEPVRNCTLECEPGIFHVNNQTCSCVPTYVNCDLFDRPYCKEILEGGFCNTPANRVTCAHTCGMCSTSDVSQEIELETSGPFVFLEGHALEHVSDTVCGSPPHIANSHVYVNGATFMSVAVYECVTGHTASGLGLAQCQEDGFWMSVRFQCTRDTDTSRRRRSTGDCGTPPAVAGMRMSYSSTTPDSQAMYSCSHGAIQVGPGISHCLDDHTWTRPHINCMNGTDILTAGATLYKTNTAARERILLSDCSSGQSCPLSVRVQSLTRRQSTYYYTLITDRSETDLFVQSATRISTESWNSLDGKLEHQFDMFMTHADSIVFTVSKHASSWREQPNTHLVWWLKRNSCIVSVDASSRNALKLLTSGGMIQGGNVVFFGDDHISAQQAKRVPYTHGHVPSTASWVIKMESSKGIQRIIWETDENWTSIVNENWNAIWFIDTCWHEVDINQLLLGVHAGHRVMVRVGNVQAIPHDVIVYNGQVTVTLPEYLFPPSELGYSGDSKIVGQTVSTTGDTTLCSRTPGSPHSPRVTRLEEARTWYVDTRPWVKVLTTDDEGVPETGSVTDLVSSIEAGKDVLLSVVHVNGLQHYTMVDVVTLRDRAEVVAEISHHPSVELGSDWSISLRSECNEWSAIISTGGLYTVYEYLGYEGRRRNVTDFVLVQWFVS